MGQKLIIAEKSDAAKTIAKVIHDTWGEEFSPKKGYLEGKRYVVSWCSGHLVELAMPEDYDENLKKWRAEDLPIIPRTWKHQVMKEEKAANQFAVLQELMERPAITGLVNAADAGREGELIFRLVYMQVGCTKPVMRLWASTTAEEDIKDALLSMKPSENYDALYYAAACRSMQDWLVGINATRKYTCEYGKTLTVGRVQTPTLAMVVDRDNQIEGFQKTYFYKLVFTDAKGTTFTSGAYEKREDAEAAAAACTGKPFLISLAKTERKKAAPPLLYSTTELQKDAGKLYGFSPAETLALMQSLYDNHIQSYPRTDAIVISTAQRSFFLAALKTVSSVYNWPPVANPDVDRLIDDGKITDHPAVTVTKEFSAEKLPARTADELLVLRLVANRMLLCSAEDYEYDATKVIATCAGVNFEAKGIVTRKEGWRLYRGLLSSLQPDTPLPPYQNGETVNVEDAVAVVEKETAPPARYTASTLLEAMEKAGKKDMEDDVERTGIGTSATRAETIEKLIRTGYMEMTGKKNILVSTEKGRALIAVMPSSLRDVTMTVDWENRMLEIRKAPADVAKGMANNLMGETVAFVKSLISDFQIDAALKASTSNVDGKNGVGKCPLCGKTVCEGKKSWFCAGYKEGCQFSIWKEGEHGVYPTLHNSDVNITTAMVTKLLEKGKTNKITLKSLKTGANFEAYLVLNQYAPGKMGLAFEFPNDSGSAGKKKAAQKGKTGTKKIPKK